MNLLSNILTWAKSQKRKGINEASAMVNNKITQIQSFSDLPNYVLIHNKDESPPGRSRSSGSNIRLHSDINRIASKSNIINNKEEFIYNKSKANYIF